MDTRKIVLRETGATAIGVAAGTAAMVGVFALLGFFSFDVVLGGIAGAALAVLNFFGVAVTAMLAADRAGRNDIDGGKKLLSSSYPIRLLILAALLIVFAGSGYFNVVALVLPLTFVRPTITLTEFFRKKGA